MLQQLQHQHFIVAKEQRHYLGFAPRQVQLPVVAPSKQSCTQILHIQPRLLRGKNLSGTALANNYVGVLQQERQR